MALDFNTEPYFDDYDAKKDFYRILFRPSYAVQARELTQLQTILQNQVTRFGDHVFKNGAQVIPGSINVDNKVHFIKLEQYTGTSDVTTYLEQFKDKIITGVDSGVKLRVIDTSASGFIDPLDYAAPNNVPTLYCKVEGSITDEANRFDLLANENLVATVADNQIKTNFRLKEDLLLPLEATIKKNGNLGDAATYYTGNASTDVVGYAYSVEVKAGIYYIDGIFVRNDDLKIYAGRFDNTPSCRVGFKVTEETITPEDDDTILDNATGSYNFAAPGAHRHKISVSLVKLDLVSTDSFKFIELVRLVDGRVHQIANKASYAELEKTFARRTFDESGNYEVNKFKLSVREHLNNGTNYGVYEPLTGTPETSANGTILKTYGDDDKFVVVVDPGKAYVQGYEVECAASQFIDFNKARVIDGVENNHVQRTEAQTVSISSGNYVRVTGVYKTPNLNTFEKVYLVRKLQNRPATLRATYDSNTKTVTGVVIIDGGSGYTVAPKIEFEAVTAAGSGAAATCTITNGAITAVTVSNGGSNYAVAPSILCINPVTVGGAAPIVLGGSAESADIVGTARVKGIQLDSGNYTDGGLAVYKLGLFDINMFNGLSFERDVKGIVGQYGSNNFTCDVESSGSLAGVSGFATCTAGSKTVTGVGTLFSTELKQYDVIYINGKYVGAVDTINNMTITLVANSRVSETNGVIERLTASLVEPSNESLLFPVGKSFVKTLRGFQNDSDTKKNSILYVRRSWPADSFSGTSCWFDIEPDGELFVSDLDISNFLLVRSDTNIPVRITPDDIVIDSDQQKVTFNNVPIGSYYLIATVQLLTAAAAERTKTINREYQQVITGETNLNLKSIQLQKTDILKLIKVEMTPGNYNTFDELNSIDITNRFTLDNGQRSTYYTNGRLLVKAGSQVPSGAIRVTYDFFSGSGAVGGYFSVDSYTTTSGVDYTEIPSHFITDRATGKKVEVCLSDVLDFRPILGGDNYGNYVPEMPFVGSVFTSPVANYLGRIDKLVLDSVGKFNIISGVPSQFPQEPEDPKEGLVLATLTIPPYTKTLNEVVLKQRENRRYTMRDIGKLERRISNLEYYVTLSLLEKETSSLQIRDENDKDRFKNGFIVDQFTGHNVGDVMNEDYKISVDSANRILRPMHQQHSLEIVEDIASSIERANKKYAKTGDLITLPYTEEAYIFNPHATRSLDIQTLSMGAFKGQVSLYPEGDNWKSTTRRPDLVAVDDNNYDAIKFMADSLGVTGTKWDEWQTHWTSITTEKKRSQSQSGNVVTGYESTITNYVGYNDRSGIETTLTSTVNAQDYGDRVIDMSYIPYMRARPVTFIANNLKGGTRFWPFFDGIDVSKYVVPADIFKVQRVGQGKISFEYDDLIGNVVSDISERCYKGKVEQAFAIGDVLTNTVHEPVEINAIAVNGENINVTVQSSSGIRPGHHVILYNLDNHKAFDTKNLDDLDVNQNIPASIGINSNTNTAKELNLRKFKVISVSSQIVTLAPLDGELGSVSAYSTASYATGYKGMLYRYMASCVVAYGGYIDPDTGVDEFGTLVQDIHVINIKHGFAVNEDLQGQVYIKGVNSFNGVTIKSINGSSSETAPATFNVLGDTTGQYNKIITDVNGVCVGVFHIPETDELAFRTGERTFKLTDNQSNSNSSIDSIGSSVYYSTGVSLTKEKTIVSTRTIDFVQADTYEDTKSLPPVRRTTTSTRVIYQYSVDPLAQTFTINSPGGAFVTSVDLYFAQVGKRPVTIELRNTDNGVPSTKVIPFSRVTKKASDLVESAKGTVATRFTFPSPVYLQDTETYCMVVMTDEPGTQIFVSEMGQVDLVTKNTIAGQPLTGSLYASQNSKEWEIHPLLDMKFFLNKAKFNTSVSSELTLRANPTEPMLLGANPFHMNTGSTKVRVNANNHGLKANELVTISNVGRGLYGTKDASKGVPETLFNTTHTVLSEGLDRNSFIIELQTTAANNSSLITGTTADFVNGQYGGLGVLCSRSLPMDLLYYKNSDIVLQDTKLQYYVSYKKADSTYTDYIPFVPNNNYYAQIRGHITSYENQEVVNNVSLPSLRIKTVLSSINENVSPVVDIQNLSAYVTWNLIDDKTADDINVPELDSRVVLKYSDVTTPDLKKVGSGYIATAATNSTAVVGLDSLFTTEIVGSSVLGTGNGNLVYRTSDDALIGIVSSITDNTHLTLASNSAIAISSSTAFYIMAKPTLIFENDSVTGLGVIRTNIDRADNLLASVGIGKTITVSNCHANVNGDYVVTNIKSSYDQTTYAGNIELDKTVVYLDRAFTTGTSTPYSTVTLDMISDTDFQIAVLDRYVSDIAPAGCQNAANYITRTLTITEAADTIKILFDANIVNNTEVKVYYRTWTGNIDLKNLPYTDTGWSATNSDPEGTFIERNIEITDLPSFNNLQIKIVMKSSNSIFVPKIKNLRLLALS